MNRLLLRQILHQWRSNVWIAIELLIVSVVLWYLVDALYVTYKYKTMPLGFNTEHCYLITPDVISADSPLRTEESDLNYGQSLSMLLDKIKHRPEVEAACVVYNGMYPMGMSDGMSPTGYINEADSCIATDYIYYQWTTSQYPLVFRLKGANGESPEDLAHVLKENKILISSDGFMLDDVKPDQFIDKQILVSGIPNTLGATIEPHRMNSYVKPTEYMIQNVGIVDRYAEIAIRVKPEMDKDIVESIFNDVNKLISGCVIVSDVRSFDDIAKNSEAENAQESRQFITIALFLLVNIFLGLLGTFWFRTQQRINEIAIRKAMGASDFRILGRIITEGIVLLTIATIPAIAIDLFVAHFQLTKELYEFIGWERTGVCIVITYLLMCSMIVLGTLFPAMKAMRINPAIALKNE